MNTFRYTNSKNKEIIVHTKEFLPLHASNDDYTLEEVNRWAVDNEFNHIAILEAQLKFIEDRYAPYNINFSVNINTNNKVEYVFYFVRSVSELDLYQMLKLKIANHLNQII